MHLMCYTYYGILTDPVTHAEWLSYLLALATFMLSNSTVVLFK